MKSVEIIVHCWAEKIPDFAAMLTAQLSSLVLWKPAACKVRVTVVTSHSDTLTRSVVASFGQVFDCGKLLLLDKCSLFKRAIGRDFGARLSLADYVWFCDADYIFGQGCLDVLAASDFKGLAYPRAPLIHESHAAGDAEIARIEPGKLFTPDLSLFKPWRVKFAIGGLQIVDGDTARSLGYLGGTRWCEPTKADNFQDTREDRIYRGLFQGSTALDLPNLYRMRHSKSAFEDAAKRASRTA